MAKQTKEDILIKARDLFNEYGYNNVSMRNVADALGMSVGNLTYYFKKKEDLIEEVVEYKHKNYKKIDMPKSLQDLNELFLNSLNIQNENAYYFKHYDQLSQISPKIYKFQLDFIKELKEFLKESFLNLQNSNLVQECTLPNQIENIIECILTILIYKPVGTKELNEHDSIKNTLNCLWSIIFMFLTEKGKHIYSNSISNQFQ
ncbi:TetR/AcrR family transcriptional regulator [Clostridioides difficile]